MLTTTTFRKGYQCTHRQTFDRPPLPPRKKKINVKKNVCVYSVYRYVYMSPPSTSWCVEALGEVTYYRSGHYHQRNQKYKNDRPLSPTFVAGNDIRFSLFYRICMYMYTCRLIHTSTCTHCTQRYAHRPSQNRLVARYRMHTTKKYIYYDI